MTTTSTSPDLGTAACAGAAAKAAAPDKNDRRLNIDILCDSIDVRATLSEWRGIGRTRGLAQLV
jgi:hypothetical protein